jgi:hypothetical protein
MRTVKMLSIAVVLLSMTPATVMAQSCDRTPPACERANDKAIAFMTKLLADGVSGISDAALKQYCVTLVGIELNNFCAAEFRRVGNSTCASLNDQQVAVMRDAAKQAEAVLAASSAANARARCTFE